jgi:hypothetical protein
MLRETSNTPVYKIKRLKTEEIMACRIYRFRRMNLSEQNEKLALVNKTIEMSRNVEHDSILKIY